MARSPQALIHILLKFSTNEPYEKIQILEQAIRKFVMARRKSTRNEPLGQSPVALNHLSLSTQRENGQTLSAFAQPRSRLTLALSVRD